MSRINMLLYHKVVPVVVFDGDRLPVKQVEETRASSRADNRAKALEALRDGNRAKATEFFQRCVDVTPAMAHRVIQALKRCGVEFIVAPYEADAQLAYLAQRGDIACVITADSDLIPYGCGNVFLKMDKLGNGHLIEASRLGEVLHGFDADMLRIFCCLTGCDYMAPIRGLGVRGAHQLVKRYVTHERIVQAVLRDAALTPPPDFALLLERALRTFRHQRVWCPTRQRIVPLTPFADAPPPADGEVDTGDYPTDEDTLYLGRQLPLEHARGVCTGELEPGTLRPFLATGAAAANSTAVADGGWLEVTRPAATSSSSSSAAAATASTSAAAIRAQTLSKAQRLAALARAGTWTGKEEDAPAQANDITRYFTPATKAATRPFQPPRADAVATTTKRDSADAGIAQSQAKRPAVKTHVFSRFFGNAVPQATPQQRPEVVIDDDDEDDGGVSDKRDATKVVVQDDDGDDGDGGASAAVTLTDDNDGDDVESSGCENVAEPGDDAEVAASEDLSDLIAASTAAHRSSSDVVRSSPHLSPPRHPASRVPADVVVLSDDDDDDDPMALSRRVAPPSKSALDLDSFAFGGGKENKRLTMTSGARSTTSLLDRIRAARPAAASSVGVHASVAAMFSSERKKLLEEER